MVCRRQNVAKDEKGVCSIHPGIQRPGRYLYGTGDPPAGADELLKGRQEMIDAGSVRSGSKHRHEAIDNRGSR